MSGTIAALRKGDETVFNGLFFEYHTKVYYFVLSRTNSAFLAEEVTQLTFIKLWQYRESLDETVAVSRQIFRIAKTTLIDQLRVQDNRSKLLAVARETGPGIENSAEGQLLEKQLRQQVMDIVRTMPPLRRKVFELSRFEGLSYKEIGEMLSLSVKAVEKQISRAIKQVRHTLSCLLAFFLLLF